MLPRALLALLALSATELAPRTAAITSTRGKLSLAKGGSSVQVASPPDAGHHRLSLTGGGKHHHQHARPLLSASASASNNATALLDAAGAAEADGEPGWATHTKPTWVASKA